MSLCAGLSVESMMQNFEAGEKDLALQFSPAHTLTTGGRSNLVRSRRSVKLSQLRVVLRSQLRPVHCQLPSSGLIK